MTIQAALFDMDGLLLDTERMWRDAFLTIAPDRPDREQFYPSLIGHRLETNRRQLSDWLGSAEAAEELLDAWEAAAKKRSGAGIPLKEGAREVVAQLSAQMPVAVVTSTNRAAAQRHLAEAGLDSYLSALVGGDDVERPKPDPEPYLTGAARLGVDPTYCAAFEDSNTGAAAAKGAGCQIVQVPDLVAPDPALDVPVAADLRAAAQLLGLM